MQLTDKNQVEITKEVTETIDLIQLDTEIAHWQDVINQAQKVIDEKQALRDSIVAAFPAIEVDVYTKEEVPVKEVGQVEEELVEIIEEEIIP